MDMWSGPESSKVLRECSKIGLFDSGVGGLSVLKELQNFAAASGRDIEFVYVGDTARCPYGNRSADEIRLFVEEIVLWLNEQNVDAVIMACNTSAALALPYAKQASRVPVLDLIGPTAGYVVEDATRIGVMATASTVRSRAFSRAITALNPEAEVVEIGCPDLVPIIESGNIDSLEAVQVLQKYVDTMKAARVDAIILGCTHFPFLRKHIQMLAEDEIRIVDPARALTSETDGVLKRFISETADGSGEVCFEQDYSLNTKFYVTGSVEQFSNAAGKCLGQELTAVNSLPLHELAASHARAEIGIPPEGLSVGASINTLTANSTTSTPTQILPQAAAS